MPGLIPLLAGVAAIHTVNVPDKLGARVSQASEASQIRVLLPETIKTEFKRVYGNLDLLSKGHYNLVLGAAKGCNGASVCGLADFTGDKGEKHSGGKRVKLAEGRTGYFIKSTCGANCSFPTIQWREQRVLYSIADKEVAAPARKAMVRLANSAIRRGTR